MFFVKIIPTSILCEFKSDFLDLVISEEVANKPAR